MALMCFFCPQDDKRRRRISFSLSSAVCSHFTSPSWFATKQSATMKSFSLFLCVCFLAPVQSKDTDRYAYCETCLAAAQEIEEGLKEVPAEGKHTVVQDFLSGGVCRKLLSLQHGHVSSDKLFSYCKQLMGTYYDQFHGALMSGKPENLKVVLCYEKSEACIGVKRKSFADLKISFTESDIEALIRDNKDNIRIAQPVHSGSPLDSRDEL